MTFLPVPGNPDDGLLLEELPVSGEPVAVRGHPCPLSLLLLEHYPFVAIAGVVVRHQDDGLADVLQDEVEDHHVEDEEEAARQRVRLPELEVRVDLAEEQLRAGRCGRAHVAEGAHGLAVHQRRPEDEAEEGVRDDDDQEDDRSHGADHRVHEDPDAREGVVEVVQQLEEDEEQVQCRDPDEVLVGQGLPGEGRGDVLVLQIRTRHLLGELVVLQVEVSPDDHCHVQHQLHNGEPVPREGEVFFPLRPELPELPQDVEGDKQEVDNRREVLEVLHRVGGHRAMLVDVQRGEADALGDEARGLQSEDQGDVRVDLVVGVVGDKVQGDRGRAPREDAPVHPLAELVGHDVHLSGHRPEARVRRLPQLLQVPAHVILAPVLELEDEAGRVPPPLLVALVGEPPHPGVVRHEVSALRVLVLHVWQQGARLIQDAPSQIDPVAGDGGVVRLAAVRRRAVDGVEALRVEELARVRV
mmetsp:Transcript_73381/g.215191  ORF Transcript_73381/g.215191 Transcript_73381/m.215191 type:complete len:470 (-) Transcript_73381:899-2308(-)